MKNVWGQIIWTLVKAIMPYAEKWLTESKDNTMRKTKK